MKMRKLLAATMCVAALVCALGVTAYAAEPEDNAAPISDTVTEQPNEGGATGGVDWDGLKPVNPLTPAGTGTVQDNATDGDGKEFFTITTEDGDVFYLVIDRQRAGNNVYFLNAVTLDDLAALAESKGKPLTVPTTPDTSDPADTTKPDTKPEPSAPGDPASAASQQTSPVNFGMLIAPLAVVAVGGGAGWYFKVYRPKHQQAADIEDYPDDLDDDEALDVGPAWDEDGDGEE